MKTALTKIIDLLNQMEQTTADEELGTLLNDAILLIEGAADRLTALDEEFDAAANDIEGATDDV
jgi:hypothetical protein